MTDAATTRPPRSYWIIAGIALAWMLVGVAAWVADLMMSEATLAGMTEGQQQLYAARPDWLFAVYGVAVFAGLAGAVGLLARKSWAVPALATSLAAVIIQFGYTLFVMDAVGHVGAAAAIPFPVAIVVIAAAVLWYARQAAHRGWLGQPTHTVSEVTPTT
ncbi:MAG TPA: hypothetical protein VK929_03040 [Longimicrobiales bacterium]|nr:hypothetical protein [Longimicrobiales bacterium]